ncbi:MAG TPA: ABC transporter ATP-binding protein [bacterium]|nr:ABC transporter ATP-binding protein [bacterium]
MLSVALRARRGGFQLEVAFATVHQRVVLFGPSGAGKTMTLQCLAGLLAPERGRIAVGETVLYDDRGRVNLPPWRRRVGLVLQSYTLLPHLSVGENVAYGLAPVWRGRERVRVETLLAAVGLGGYADRRPAQLSGGQRQRVSLAQALASDPRLLLLDEPFSAVDAPVRERLRRDLLALLDAFEVPLVFVTHDFDEAYLLGQTIVILAAGRVVQVGTPAEVAARPRTVLVAQLVGASNIVTGNVLGRSGNVVVVEAGPLRVRALGDAVGDAVGDGPRATFCLRPADVRLVAPGNDRPAATVTRVLPRDGTTSVLLAVGAVTIEAAVRGPAPAAGSVVGLEIPDAAARIVAEDAAVE